MKIKTIDVQAKEWFDRKNGNSYFAGAITINYGMNTEKRLSMPFQYGYGEHYLAVALNTLMAGGDLKNVDPGYTLWRVCRSRDIILRAQKIENCKKAELNK